jgi:CBS domain-containing protein
MRAHILSRYFLRETGQEIPMTIGTICSRDVCVASRGAALTAAVETMSKRHVGAIVVVEEGATGLKPIGIITDRDVVCGQLNPPRDLFCLSVEDVMTSDLLTLTESCEVAEAIARMSEREVRRAPVVDRDGSLMGIISIDDLLPRLAADLGALAELIRFQPAHETAPH